MFNLINLLTTCIKKTPELTKFCLVNKLNLYVNSTKVTVIYAQRTW